MATEWSTQIVFQMAELQPAKQLHSCILFSPAMQLLLLLLFLFLHLHGQQQKLALLS